MISRSHRRCGGGSKNSFTLVENNNAGDVFDPSITTSIPTTLVWVSSDGHTETTSGTTHEFSYTVPSNGPRRWTVTCTAGLGRISKIDMGVDKLISIDIKSLRSVIDARCYANANLVMSLTDLPVGLTFVHLGGDPLLTGDISDLPVGLTSAYLGGDILLTGDISDLPIELTNAHFYADSLIVTGSVAHLTKIVDLRIYNMLWSSASVDIVLLSISDAIHANVNHFTHATPSLQIGGSNLAPGGTPAAATTSPLTTPGFGYSDSDWQWDAVAGKHKALTGMAAIWVMRNNTGHTWTVTITEAP